MNILVVAPYFYPHGGGAEVYTYNIAKGLIKNKNRVTVLCSNQISEENKDYINRIHVKRLRPDFKISTTPIKLGLIKNIMQVIKENDFDLINIDFYLPYYPDIAAISSKLSKIPCTLTWHNDIVLENTLLNSAAQLYNYSVNRLTLNLVDKIITPSPYCYNYSKFLESFKNKLLWIPPGVYIEKYTVKKSFKIHETYHIPHSSKIVLFVGVMNESTAHKGLYYLIKAFRRVLKDLNNDPYLVLVGKGDMVPQYKKMCHDLGIKDNVIFTGFVSDELLIDFYRSSDLLVLPSTTVQEGFGMVLIEANACGKPVIGSKIGGIQHVIRDGETGILVPPKNHVKLADAIMKILKDEQMAESLGENGRKLVETLYSWEKSVKKTSKVYGDLL